MRIENGALIVQGDVLEKPAVPFSRREDAAFRFVQGQQNSRSGVVVFFAYRSHAGVGH